MLKFLSSLFAPTAQPDEGPDQALIDAAIERVVDGTDSRLRIMSKYRNRLREPVLTAVNHVIALVDSLPPPAEIGEVAYSADPRIRAFFASADHLREIMGGSQSIRAYLQDPATPAADAIFGLLAMEWEERKVLGMEVQGETIRRDVQQVEVNFFHHRYICPTGTEPETRRELMKRAFDFLIEAALDRIAAAKGKRVELERERRLLRRKLEAMKAGKWGLESMLAGSDRERPDLPALEAQIDAVETELHQLGADRFTLEQTLEYIVDTLGRATDWLALRPISLRLDYKGTKVAETASVPSNLLQLSELGSCTGEKRIVLLARTPRAELPEPLDFFAQAHRYLG